MNLREQYINYFKENKHSPLPSAPLMPDGNSNVLFNTAGMQPLIPYLMGKPHPEGKRLVNCQKCIRTSDLDSVGDKTHHTFFEMLGNWSLGDYFKEESIKYSFDFLTKELNIPIERLAVTVFKGNENIPKDEISANIWLSLGIKKERIAYLGEEDNFWIAGETGPCGGDTEIFYYRSKENPPSEFNPEDENWVEIWNNVFMEYNKNKDGSYSKLPFNNVDTGMGLERTIAILEGVDDNYKSSLWTNAIRKLEELSGIKYNQNKVSMRIISDHFKAAVFILSEGITPSNTDQGYILRRLIRRAVRHIKMLNIDLSTSFEEEIANIFIEDYKKYYPELLLNKDFIISELSKEKNKFTKTLERGLKEFSKVKTKDNTISGEDAFRLYDTYGFPIELTTELASEQDLEVDLKGFEDKFKEHQEKSRKGAEGKFNQGGMQELGEKEIKLHTATHLLNAALKQIVNENIHQKGSNITSERLRFDFNHDGKVPGDLLDKTEDLVNKWIKEEIDITFKEMTKEETLASGAECVFLDRYPEKVTVYYIGDFSSELCGGPHVKNTKELGEFKITKEESSSSGVRRIRATLTP